MGRKKNPNKKTTEEIVREALDSEQKQFVATRQSANFDAPVKKQSDSREAFRVFWASAKKEYKKAKDLEEVLWIHLKASGFDKPELFTQGLKHFGLKK